MENVGKFSVIVLMFISLFAKRFLALVQIWSNGLAEVAVTLVGRRVV